ncbi:MAG TPA: ketoacyl-synthetase C-terminal extension domain-containing protein, partial [Methylophilaceae bacterium]
TGTPLGDPIEVNGLKKVSEGFGSGGKSKTAKPKIALGALKSHVGHMEATAGVGGVIKTLLSMKYRMIPQNLNFAELNPHISLENSPYFIPTGNVELGRKNAATKLLGGVNSFGFGGVNAHVVIESHDVASPLQMVKKQKADQGADQNAIMPYLINISGKDENSLRARVHQLIQFLQVSCDTSDALTSKAVMEALRTSLNVADDVETTPLASLDISPSRWSKALKALAPLLGRALNIDEVQNCISLQEAAQEIARNTQINELVVGSDKISLCSRVALPEAEIRAAGLDSIAYTLMHGRDSLRQRLACVVDSKAELLSLLQAYLKAPEASHPNLWTHAVRMDETATNSPAAITDTTLESLSAWGEWWVKTRSATLDWETLYPQAAKPRKFPLPAYPFQLDHIWYKAGAVVEPQAAVAAQVQTPTQPVKNLVVREQLVLPAAIATAWDIGMAHSQLPIPSSVMTLAYLLDYAIYKNQGTPVELENVVFGPPCDVQDERLVFGYSPGDGYGVMQCLAARDDRRILAQATLKNHYGKHFIAPESAFTSAAPLPVESFFAQLENERMSLGKMLHCLDSIHAGEQKLKFELVLPEWQSKDGRFWVPLMATILAGLSHLQPQHGRALQLPWQIDSVVFNPEPAQAIKTVYLQLDPNRNTASVMAMDAASRPVLQLDGIVVRVSSVTAHRAEASLA